MKSFLFPIFVLTILIFSNAYAKEIKAKLTGHSVPDLLTLEDNADGILFNETGEALLTWGDSIDYDGNPRSTPLTLGEYEDQSLREHAFYVDNTANGNYDGRSWANAWNPTSGWDSSATNTHAINWSSLGAGDTLYISGGLSSKDYTSSDYLLPKANGSYTNYLVIIKGQDAGHNGTPIIDRIGTIEGGSHPGNKSETSLIHNHCIEFNGLQITRYIAHQDEVQTNNFVPNGYHLRFKNIIADDVNEDKFFDFTGHPRYIEIIDCYLRQRPSSSNQTDLIWIRGDSDYPGGGLAADSIFIVGNTLICTNQSPSPHTDGIQTFTTQNLWIEGNKLYVANNKSAFTQVVYNEEALGNIYILNNIIYVAVPTASSPLIALSRNYDYNGFLPDVDSLYIYDNTIVANNTAGRTPYMERAMQIKMGNNIFINTASGSSHIQIYTANTATTSDYNVLYSPSMSTKVYRLGSNYSFSSWQGTGRDTHSTTTQPSFTSFDWSFSQTEATYLNYNFNVPSPVTGQAFSIHLGNYSFTSDEKIGALIPSIINPIEISGMPVIKGFNLFQNYPNPFNPNTIIRYSIPAESKVTVKLYNLLGQEMKQLVNATESAGYHDITFNAGNLASGIYFYRISVVSTDGKGEYADTKKLMLIR